MNVKSLGIALSLCLLVGCTPSVPPAQNKQFFAMDTYMDFSVYDAPSTKGKTAELLDKAEEMVSLLEKQISVTDTHSNLYHINQTGQGTLPTPASTLMAEALTLSQQTGGDMDIAIYPLVRAWGFTTDSYRVPAPSEIQSLLPITQYQKIRFDPSNGSVHLAPHMMIDLGSVAKGFIGKSVAQMLKEQGVSSAILNFGGNIQTIGAKPDGKPWNIAIQSPTGGSPIGVLAVEDMAVVTSGGYERYFEQDGKTYWHILNPKTGYPAQKGLSSVTIIGKDGTLCDAFSTACFVKGLDDATAFWRSREDFEAVFLTEQNELYVTEGIAPHFSIMEEHADMPVHILRK